ncbi:hypothetical protein AV530_016473 [Patagioenas fasciata monilis]|uniref:Uncharacterized protein n=1 Tax=Patagioenas fasciata monilis TaxID=372326 RepID=A0A1V4J3R7_PATFA|nr:hypothetical protein AV530_016473 [Patagioenas fasciata monilis]
MISGGDGERGMGHLEEAEGGVWHGQCSSGSASGAEAACESTADSWGWDLTCSACSHQPAAMRGERQDCQVSLIY